MADDEVLAHTVRLTSAVDALAALAAFVRIETEGLDADPELRAVLGRIAGEVLGGDATIGGESAAQAVGMARAFLRSAVDTVEHPARRGEWAVIDPVLLQGIGRLSGAIASAVVAAEQVCDGLGSRLRSPGAVIADVGLGTGWLSIALARAYPEARVVGLDVFDTALALARENVGRAGLADRVEVRLQDVATIDDQAVFDTIWLPLPFLPRRIVPEAMARSVRALKPGGWLLPGVFAGPPDLLSQLLLDLRTMRSGGHPWSADEVVAMLGAAGLDDVREVPRTWAAPVRLFAGRRR